jgi:hypothetical protein
MNLQNLTASIRLAVALCATALPVLADFQDPEASAVFGFQQPPEANPELKSRAFAWSEYDGSYLVNPQSRAEVLNFYWNVLARPVPALDWSGTTNPINAGTINAWARKRELSQLSAYRALVGSQPMRDNPVWHPDTQAAALMWLLNPAVSQRNQFQPGMPGYTAAAAQILLGNTPVTISVAGGADPNGPPPIQFIDGKILRGNFPVERTDMLQDWNTQASYGAAYGDGLGYFVWHQPRQNPPADREVGKYFIAWPPPGLVPRSVAYRLSTGVVNPTYQGGKWTFYAAADTFATANASVSISIRGVSIKVQNIDRPPNPAPLSWDVAPEDLPPFTSEDTPIDVTISNVLVGGIPRTYKYTVTLFNEETFIPEAFNPKTPLLNISTRGKVGSGDNVLIAGLSVGGVTPMRVALRAQGPGLAAFGIANPAKKPRLTLYDSSGAQLGTNAGWREHTDWRLLQSFQVSPSRDDEPAMVATLWPGNYTVILSDDGGADGIGIIEAFNIDNLTESRLLNISTRGTVGVGESQMIAGFAIKDKPRTLVIRTQGPSLAAFGVSNPVADTVLSVVAQADGREIGRVDNWRDSAANARLKTDLAAFAPRDDREAAIVVRLDPGNYSALASPKGASGVGIIEVFEISEP